MKTIISIVTPSFNQGPYIEETIKSILSQKGDFFIDYIIMDGGSADESVEIIKKYEKLLQSNCASEEREGLTYFVPGDSSFAYNNCLGISYRWVSERDRGQVHALKKGYEIAKGEIFCWLNSDDVYIGNGVLKEVVNLFDIDPDLKMLTADGSFIDASGQVTGTHHVNNINLKELIFLDYHILQPSTFFKREIYNHDSLNEKLVCAFDAEFFIDLIAKGVKYKKTDDVFSGFRIYPEIKTISLSGKRYREQMSIACKHSNNVALLLISAVYRYCEIVLKQKYYEKSSRFRYLFNILHKVCYKFISGERELWSPPSGQVKAEYKLGDILSCKDEIKANFQSWSPAEQGHRWTSGSLSAIRFCLQDTISIQKKYNLTIKGAGFGIQRIDVILNGTFLGECIVKSFFNDDGSASFETKSFVVGGDKLNSNADNLLEFKLPGAACPGNGDNRQLGLAFSEMCLSERPETKSNKILFVYPHNFFDRSSGINVRFYELARYFTSRGFSIDVFGLTNFESDWNKGNVHDNDVAIDSLYLYDFSKGYPEHQARHDRAAKETRKKVKPVDLKYYDLPDFAFEGMKKQFKEIVSEKNYKYILISYVFWANLIETQVVADTTLVLDLSDFITLNLFEAENGNVDIGPMIGEEIRRVNLFDKVLCISDEEQRLFSQFALKPEYYFVPFFMNKPERIKLEKEFDICCIGSDNPHNKKGVQWFFDKVYPFLPSSYKILIVGKISNHISEYKNVVRTVFLEDIGEAYAKSKISICPLLGGTGMKIKVVESMAYGIPVVTTSKGIVGMPPAIINRFLVADQPEEFATNIIKLVSDDVFYAEQSQIAEDIFLNHFEKQVNYQKLDEIFY